MPPIPIFSSSPINAQTAQGITPKTVSPDTAPPEQPPAATTTTAPPPPPTSTSTYPPPQPGAAPVPAPTGIAPSGSAAPTPPAPTPAAVAAAPTRTAPYFPPPPTTAATANPSPPMPQPLHMHIPPPTHADRGMSTATASPYAHPPGYQQNTNAGGYQNPSAYHQPHGSNTNYTLPGVAPADHNDDDAGLWDHAKRWAKGAGESLAAAESEVWKKIGSGK